MLVFVSVILHNSTNDGKHGQIESLSQLSAWFMRTVGVCDSCCSWVRFRNALLSFVLTYKIISGINVTGINVIDKTGCKWKFTFLSLLHALRMVGI